jgi:hypothetical protein
MSVSTNRIAPESLTVTTDQQPGWLRGSDRMPAVGDLVHCTEGMARVVRIAGRTGDGSRLLELSLPERPKQPFFAAASNVLVAPEGSTIVG